MSEPEEPILMELKSMNKRLGDLDEDINRIDRDLSTDRKDIEYLKIQVAEFSASMKSVLDTLTRMQTKMKDAVNDAVAESTAPVREQMEQFVDKKVIRVKVPMDTWSSKVLALIHKFSGKGVKENG